MLAYTFSLSETNQVGDINSIFGISVRAKRSQLGISQEELADRAGLHRTYISDVERGSRNPSLASIEKLARALELSVPMLFERSSGDDFENTPSQRVEVFLVDSNARDVKLTLRAFQTAGIANPVRVFRDGARALNFLSAINPSGHPPGQGILPAIILLALDLPKVSGLEVLQKLKALPRTRGIPVIILTASSRGHDVAACQRMGAEACLAKPIEFQKLHAVTPRLKLQWLLLKASPTSSRT